MSLRDDIKNFAKMTTKKTGTVAQTIAEASGEFAQSAAKKSKEVMEITKLRFKIMEDKSEIKANSDRLGRYMYEKYADCIEEAPEDVKDFLDEIYQLYEEISQLNDKIAEIKAATSDLAEEDSDEEVKEVSYTEITVQPELKTEDEKEKLEEKSEESDSSEVSVEEKTED